MSGLFRNLDNFPNRLTGFLLLISIGLFLLARLLFPSELSVLYTVFDPSDYVLYNSSKVASASSYLYSLLLLVFR
uniref:Uncharacterized protein n=1 Tax=Solanum tuberosum TaxID=4113 RepID=M1CJP6_SOLTU